MSSKIVPFYPIFNDIDGDPLDAGYIYIGTENLDPESNPINVFWDEALTVAATQPIRTLNGYPSRSGSPAAMYVAEAAFSITVRNRNGSLVTSTLSETNTNTALAEDLANTTDTAKGDALVGVRKAGANAVARTVHLALGDITSVYDHGDPEVDLGEAINRAIADGKKQIWIPQRATDYPLGTKALLNARGVHVFGDGVESCSIDIQNDVIGFDLNQPHTSVRGFSLKSTLVSHSQAGIQGGDSGSGNCGRAIIANVYIDGVGGDGIVIRDGNLGTLQDIVSINNGQDGIRFTDETPNNNAWGIAGFLDLRSNTRHGFYLEGGTGPADQNAARSISGGLIVTQQNGGDGVLIESRSNNLAIYSEANGGTDINITSIAYGNRIYSVEGGTLDNGVGSFILDYNSGASYLAYIASQLLLKDSTGMKIGNQTVAGTLKLDKIAAAQHRLFLGDTGQAQRIRFKNIGGLATPDTDTPLYPAILDFESAVIARDRLIFADGDTTPDVSLSEFWLANNSGATTITTFDGGQPGQVVHIVANNGNTTLQWNAGATGLKLKSGANKTLAQYEGITFIQNGGGWWIEV